MPIKVQGGKQYNTVAERLVWFEEKYPKHCINTSVDFMDGKQVIMRSEIISPTGAVVSTGHAHARFGADQFTDKLVEKCETCAVGRSLAFMSIINLGGSGDIASADEIVAAIDGARYQAEMSKEHATAIFNLLDAVNLDTGEGVDAFAEAWLELDDSEQQAIGPHFKRHYPGDISKQKEFMRNVVRAYRLKNQELDNAVPA